MLALKFPGNQFKGEIAPAIRDLVESGTIRVIDILFVAKDENGEVAMIEINDLDDDDFRHFDPIVEDVTEMLSEEDVKHIGSGLENNSSAALMLFENTWATRLRDAFLNAKAEVLFLERIPYSVIEALTSSDEEEASETAEV
jgi:hypothetical protein